MGQSWNNYMDILWNNLWRADRYRIPLGARKFFEKFSYYEWLIESHDQVSCWYFNLI